MSMKTNIQWCHSTVNPIMGCGGCELFPYPKTVLDRIDDEAAKVCASYEPGHAKRYLKQCLVVCQMGSSDPIKLTTTNIYHLRQQLAAEME